MPRATRGFRGHQRQANVVRAQAGPPGATVGRTGRREHEPVALEPHTVARLVRATGRPALVRRVAQAVPGAVPGQMPRARDIAARVAPARARGTGVPVQGLLLAAPGPSGVTDLLATGALPEHADRNRSGALLARLAAVSRLTGDGTDQDHAVTDLRPHDASGRLSAPKLPPETSLTPTPCRARWDGRRQRAGTSGHERLGHHARSFLAVVKGALGEPAVGPRAHRVQRDPLVVAGRPQAATTDPRRRHCGEAPPVPLLSAVVVVLPRVKLGGARQRFGASSEVTRSKVARQFASSWSRAGGRCTKSG